MSTKLAGLSALAEEVAPPTPVRRGPRNSCFPLYGAGDMADMAAVDQMRDLGYTWEDVQHRVDELLGIEKPIAPAKFKYHWRRRCFCWPEANRTSS